jgi:hypothetical protein
MWAHVRNLQCCELWWVSKTNIPRVFHGFSAAVITEPVDKWNEQPKYDEHTIIVYINLN